MNVELKASMWYTVCNFLQKGIAVITTPIFSRLLTSEQFGEYAVFNAWSDILFVFTTLKISVGIYNNGLLKYKDDRSRYASSTLGLSTTITSFTALIYIIVNAFQPEILGLSNTLVVIMFLQFYLTPPTDFWMAEQRFDYKYKKVVAITFLMSILTPVVGIAAVVMTQKGADARIAANAAVVAIVGMVFYVRIMQRGKTFVNVCYWWDNLKLGIPLIPHYLSQVFLNNSDRIMIRSLCDSAKAGIYSIAYSAGNLLTILNGAINASLTPWTYRCLEKKEYGKIRATALPLVGGVGLFNLILCCCAPELVSILAPAEYHESSWMIVPISMGAFMQFVASLSVRIELYMEKTKYISIFSILVAVLNIILNFAGISKWGYTAAAYTTFISYFVFAYAHYWCMARLCKKNGIETIPVNIKAVSVIVFIITATSFGCMQLYHEVALRYALLTVFIIAGTACYRKYKNLMRVQKP
jgi:O-antigen/teichoic acid export membrane protein